MPERDLPPGDEIRLTEECSNTTAEGVYAWATTRASSSSSEEPIESPRPRSWRETILDSYPNSAPLMGMLDQMRQPTLEQRQEEQRESMQRQANELQVPMHYIPVADPVFDFRIEAGEIPDVAETPGTMTVYPERRMRQNQNPYSTPYRPGEETSEETDDDRRRASERAARSYEFQYNPELIIADDIRVGGVQAKAKSLGPIKRKLPG